MATGILALQGAFAEHAAMLDRLGEPHFEIRQARDLEKPLDRLIIPGGESTVMRRLLHDLDLFDALRARIAEGMPVFGTCAGLILLAKQVDGGVPCFATMDIAVKRNAYGRQLGSFFTNDSFEGLGTLPMTFIRAPYIESVSGGAKAQASIPQIVADTLRANHPAPYTNITKEAFDAQAEALTQNWDELEEQGEAGFAMCRWVASLKDEHTQLFDGAWYNVRTPYVVMAVEGKYVIVQGQECAKPYLGWTIAAVGDMPIEEVETALSAYISFETEGCRRTQTARNLRMLALLREIGATDSMDAVEVTLENPLDGETQTVVFESLTEYAYGTSTILPLADTLLQRGTYRATLAEEGTLFIQYNECTNDENMPMKDFAAALDAQLTSAPEKIIVDLRHNGGGNSSVIQPLIQLLQKYEEQGSRLFALIGAGTFSSAVMNAEDLREIGATLVGETTGGTIGFGELNAVNLKDMLYLMYSTKDFANGAPHKPVEPDILIPQTLSDFEKGVDTAVQAVLELE